MAVQVGPEEISPMEKIGEGAFSEVFRAVCRGRLVALKKWRNSYPTEKEIHDIFREIEIGGFVLDNVIVFPDLM